MLFKIAALLGYGSIILFAVACGGTRHSYPAATPQIGANIEATLQAEIEVTVQPTAHGVAVVTPTVASSLATNQQPTKLEKIQPKPRPMQIGVNFIRFFFTAEESSHSETAIGTAFDHTKPDSIFGDFSDLGVHAFRQFIKADMFWERVEPTNDDWAFTMPDQVLPNQQFEPIVTLFSLQYASPTPPWLPNKSDFHKTLGPDAEDYLETLIDRYGEYVKYWELGNEMGHWAGAADPRPGGKLPSHVPDDGFTPEEQGIFLKEVSEFIRARDPDAVIVLPGMGGLGTHTLDYWLTGVIKGAGGHDWFDIVNYHHYGSWQNYLKQRPLLDAARQELGIMEKPVWLTETGSTSSGTLTIRSDYPNSEKSQSADVFRRVIQAFGHGDELVLWHTYIGSAGEENDWRDYGMRDPDGRFKPAYYSYRLLVEELIPYREVKLLSSSPVGVNSYAIVTEDGNQKFVIWGRGLFEIPDEVEQMTSVFSEDGIHRWDDVVEGSSITLSDIPVLMK